MPKQYRIKMSVVVDSSLSAKELNTRLIVALYDMDSGYAKLSDVDDDLKVVDYEDIKVNKI